MRTTLSLLTIFLTSVASWATDVETMAGQLARQLTDSRVTELTLHGTIDARDFKFIADSLDNLATLNLSDVRIVAHEATEPIFGMQLTYEADAIPRMAFFGSNLSAVALPATLQAVGHSAFAGCDKLTAIELPATLTTIAPYAFSGTGLVTVEIPAGVDVIGQGAFANCTSLSTAAFAGSVIGKQAFMGDSALTQLTLGEALTEVDDEAFHHTSLSTVDLSGCEALSRIGQLAFADGMLTHVVLPQREIDLGDGAFFNNPLLSSVNLPAGLNRLPHYVMAGNEALPLADIIPLQADSIGDYALYNCAQPIDTLVIPATVAHIGTRALAGTTGVKAIYTQAAVPPTLGDSVWAGINQPAVILDTREDTGNEVADLYAQAEQWQEFYILRNHLLGDVNRDGDVNIADLTAAVNIILENYEDEQYDMIAADLNEDRSVDIADVTALANTILEVRDIVERRYAPRRDGSEPDAYLRLDDLSIGDGEQRNVSLYLDNRTDFNALQCDITLPEGLTIVAVNATERTAGHHWAMANAGRVTRLMVSSGVNEPIAGHDGAIATLTIAATDNAGGSMEVDNAIAADARARAHRIGGAQAQASVVTGVDEPLQAAARVSTRGNLLIIDTPQPCTAQLVSVNGVSTTLQLAQGRNESVQPAGIYVVIVGNKSHKVVIR